MPEDHYRPVLSPRDRAVFRDLIESRVMTLAQITELHFAGSYEYAKKRLQRLKSVDYVAERKPSQNPGRFFASTLSLARPGFEAFADDPFVIEEGMRWDHLESRLDFAHSSLAHELEVVDMKVAFVKAMRAAESRTLEEFSTYPRRFEFTTEHLERGTPFTLKPDAYARISGPDRAEEALFFEWDRSSEAHRKLGIKAFGYERYFNSGAFAIWNGLKPTERERYPLTAVFILPNDERRNNAAEHLLRVRHPKSGARLELDTILLTTHAEFLADPLSAIYVTPAAYQRATRGTQYDPAVHKATTRLANRDRLVAGQIEKTWLFGGES